MLSHRQVLYFHDHFGKITTMLEFQDHRKSQGSFHVAAGGFLSSQQESSLEDETVNLPNCFVLFSFFFFSRKISPRREVLLIASPSRAASSDLTTQREAGSCSRGGSRRCRERVQKVRWPSAPTVDPCQWIVLYCIWHVHLQDWMWSSLNTISASRSKTKRVESDSEEEKTEKKKRRRIKKPEPDSSDEDGEFRSFPHQFFVLFV